MVISFRSVTSSVEGAIPLFLPSPSWVGSRGKASATRKGESNNGLSGVTFIAICISERFGSLASHQFPSTPVPPDGGGNY